MSPSEFLEKHLGQVWHPVKYEPGEYGTLGEPISICPTSDDQANGYQSTMLSDDVATQTGKMLKHFGLENPKDYTRVDTGQGIVLLFPIETISRAMLNQKLIDATTRKQLISKTGMEKFVDSVLPTEMSPSATEEARIYLNNITRDLAPDALWRVQDKKLVLMDLDPSGAEVIKELLMENGIPSQFIAGSSEAGSDSIASGAELEVNIQTVNILLSRKNEGPSRS